MDVFRSDASHLSGATYIVFCVTHFFQSAYDCLLAQYPFSTHNMADAARGRGGFGRGRGRGDKARARRPRRGPRKD